VRRQALSRGQVGSDGAFPWTHTSAFSVRRGLEPGPRLDSICEVVKSSSVGASSSQKLRSEKVTVVVGVNCDM
jgi:hypothetical protein